MSRDKDISARGVYYNLEISPYRYESPNGEIFKFSSQKKMDMFVNRVETLRNNLIKMIDKYRDVLGEEWMNITIYYSELCIYKHVYDNMKAV